MESAEQKVPPPASLDVKRVSIESSSPSEGPPSSKRAKLDPNETTIDESSEIHECTNDSSSADSSSSSRENDHTNNNSDNDDNNDSDEDDGEVDCEDEHYLDREELEFEGDDDEDLFRQIIEAARAGHIPLEFLRAHGIHVQLEDDNEPVEYPFESPPKSIADVAEFIRSDKCQRVMVLSGAGMSVASGIPDFRSSNGLYATLNASKLTATPEQVERIRSDPSYSLDQHLFLENPLPCLEVNREFILGVKERKWKATLAHRFIEGLRSKVQNKDGEGKLVRLYTQNIDGLEDQCEGIGHQRRIAVHGSMDEAECAMCNASMDFDRFCEKVRTQIKDITGTDPSAPAESTAIACESCGAKAIKPSIVLFRSRLPEVFFQNVPNDVKDIDLLLVLGTSLAVAPANSLVARIPRSAMRVLMNREPVGWHLGLDCESNDRDYFAGGNCETTALDFMEELGWLDDMKPLLERGEFPESSAKLLRERLDRVQQKKEQPQSQDGAAKREDIQHEKIEEPNANSSGVRPIEQHVDQIGAENTATES